MEELGHSTTAWAISYALPSLPWDVGASFPGYLRELADQANENQRRVDQGKEPKEIDFMRALGRIAEYISPLRGLKQAGRPLAEIGDIIQGSSEERAARKKEEEQAAAVRAATERMNPTLPESLQSQLADALDDLRGIFVGG